MPRPGPSRPRKLDTGPALEFIHFVHPSDLDGQRSSRGRVREHVARIQHQRASYSQYSQNMQILNLGPETRASLSGPQQGLNPAVRLTGTMSATDDEADTNRQIIDLAEWPSLSLPEIDVPPVLPPSPRGSLQEDPFWTYPVPYSPLRSRMISHYIQHMTSPVPELDGPLDEALLRTYWFPLAMQSPATLYAVLLMTASHCRFELLASNLQSHVRESDVLELRSCALQEINRTFTTSTVALSVGDTMIAAVAKLAVFEALFGDQEVFSQHMTGLRKMVGLRRELDGETGSLDGFVARLVLWIDVNTSHFTGRPRTFVGDEHGLISDIDIREANPISFAGVARTQALLQSSNQT